MHLSDSSCRHHLTAGKGRTEKKTGMHDDNRGSRNPKSCLIVPERLGAYWIGEEKMNIGTKAHE